jgi:hypothetical protein
VTTDRELVQDSVQTVGQIFSNYQAALHLLEETVAGETVAPDRALEVLKQAAREVFAPVLDACAGVAPGLDDLVAESIGGPSAMASAARDLVGAERQRVAITHSRLITRQAGLTNAGGERSDRAALVGAAGRLHDLESGSHSAGALYQVLLERWKAPPS